MNRTALIIALGIAVSAGLVFGFYPAIDLSIAQAVYDATHVSDSSFAGSLPLMASIVRKIGFWIEIVLIASPLLAFLVKLILPRTKMLVPGRAVVFLVTSLVLGPGLLVNVALKDHWERPRPGQLLQFGGNQHFVPWWQWRGDCRKNCSFVSGEAATAFWTLAPAALTPPLWRPLAFAAAIAFGSIISMERILMGGHFLSDTIFAGVFTFLIIWLLYAIIYRWRHKRNDDKAIEDALERFSA